jgi:hypothetical protein
MNNELEKRRIEKALSGDRFTEDQIGIAYEAVIAASDPPRDSIILRIAERIFGDPPPKMAALWEEAAEKIKRSVPDSTFRLWIEPLRPYRYQEGVLFFLAPTGIAAWSNRRYSHLILEALERDEIRAVRVVAWTDVA